MILSGVYPAGSSRPMDIIIRQGRISCIKQSAEREPRPGQKLWVSPGIIDAHTHLVWTDFEQNDQDARSAGDVLAAWIRSYTQTVLAGVSAIRDAGGLTKTAAACLREKTGLPLDTHLSVYMLDSADARSSAYLTRRVIDLVDSGAEWIKLMVTGGVGTPSEEVLDPHFSQEEIELVIRTAHEKGAKVMAHVWGGIGLDWLIQAGVDSVEHGVYISDIQAQALAASGAFLVPTAAIYRLIAEGLVGNNRELQRRAALAAEAHPRSIYRAREAGVPLVLGTDYGSPKEHGQNLKEIDALTSCGLSREEAWTAATLTGAALLGRSGQIGAVKPGHRADIIVFTGDPHRADAETLGVAGVIAAGKLVRTTAALDRCIRPLGLSDHSYS